SHPSRPGGISTCAFRSQLSGSVYEQVCAGSVQLSQVQQMYSSLSAVSTRSTKNCRWRTSWPQPEALVETSVSLGVAFKNKRSLEMHCKETDTARAFVSTLSQRNSGPVDRLFGAVLMCRIVFYFHFHWDAITVRLKFTTFECTLR